MDQRTYVAQTPNELPPLPVSTDSGSALVEIDARHDWQRMAEFETDDIHYSTWSEAHLARRHGLPQNRFEANLWTFLCSNVSTLLSTLNFWASRRQ